LSALAGTHRLRTRDPLYVRPVRYTGFEQATTGDYIWLSGIKERHHRREGANAWNSRAEDGLPRSSRARARLPGRDE
jgi:hypothetical protein